MSEPNKPLRRPRNPRFSSGPCPKRPGWSPDALAGALLGRSHRSPAGRARLAAAIEESRALLRIPDDYRIGIVPASDTGAMEIALWTLLGGRGVDMLAWESFGAAWVEDATAQLGLEDLRVFRAEYGSLPDLSQVDCDRDVVFTWNGTTSGVMVPNGDWIAPDRDGLTISDATSAAFAMDLPWDRLDVVTWSWQKSMGGEAAHGMLALSPRAAQRLESYVPPWPLPKLFRLTRGGRLDEEVFRGDTINTPSMLCVEDALDGLAWGRELGGLDALTARARSNLQAVADWVKRADWVDFLVGDPAIRSCTSICLKIVDPWFEALDARRQAAAARRIEALLESEDAAYDINGYRQAPPGLRIWGGPTVERSDIEALCPWLDWAYGVVKRELAAG